MKNMKYWLGFISVLLLSSILFAATLRTIKTDIIEPNAPGGNIDIQTGVQINSSAVIIDDILDEDDMTSDSTSSLVTQQSVKAYTDNLISSIGNLGDVTLTSSATNEILSWNGSAWVNQGEAVLDSVSIGGALDASLILDMTSTTKGSKPCPVMSEAQRDLIGSPATAACVYNTDTAALNIYTGAAWEAIGGGGGGSGVTTFTTVAAAELATGADQDISYVVETETFYRYEASGSAYTDDNTFVLSTGNGGNTRWLGVAGQYIVDDLYVNGDITVTGSQSISGNLDVTGSITGEGSGITDIVPENITINSTGTPTHETLKDKLDHVQSSGYFTGGLMTDGGSGTIDISSGSGYIRANNTAGDPLIAFDFPAVSGQALTDLTTNYIYIDYNSGTPVIAVATSNQSDGRTKINIGKVFREGTSVIILQAGLDVKETIKRIQSREINLNGELARATGMIVSETGTLNLGVTSGTAFAGYTMYATGAIDTSGADTFEYYRLISGTWTESDESAIDVLQYNDVSSPGSEVLATLPNNNFGVHWVYIDVEGEVLVVYGQAAYSKLSDAEAALVPNISFGHIADMSILVAKIIIEKSDTSFTEVESAFETGFQAAPITEHSDLGGLSADDHTQYILADGSRNFSGSQTFDVNATVDGILAVGGTSTWADQLFLTHFAYADCTVCGTAGGDNTGMAIDTNDNVYFVNDYGVGGGGIKVLFSKARTYFYNDITVNDAGTAANPAVRVGGGSAVANGLFPLTETGADDSLGLAASGVEIMALQPSGAELFDRNLEPGIPDSDRFGVLNFERPNNVTTGWTGDLTIAINSTTPLNEVYDLKISNLTGNDEEVTCSENIAVPSKAQTNFVGAKLFYSYDGDDDDMEIWLEDVTNTATLNETLLAAGTNIPIQLSGGTQDDTANIRICARVKEENNGKFLYLDDIEFIVNPKIVTNVSEATEPESFTPSGNGWDTYANDYCTHERIATDMIIRCKFQVTAITGGTVVTFNLPNGETIASSIGTTAVQVGKGNNGTSSLGTGADLAVLGGSGLAYLTFGIGGTTSSLTSLTAASITNANDYLSFNATVPIKGWSATNDKVVTTSNGQKVYSEANGDFTITGSGAGTVGNCTATPYKLNGAWKLMGNCQYTRSSSNTAINLTMSGITSAANNQAVDVSSGQGSSDWFSGTLGTSSGVFYLVSSGNYTTFNMTFNVELASKPTWADDTTTQYMGAADVPRTCQLKEIQTSGTDGSGCTAASGMQTRVLNKIFAPNGVEGSCPFMTLSANEFTLSKGKYKISAYANGYKIGAHKARLYDVDNTASQEGWYGDSANSDSSGATATYSTIKANVEINTGTTFRIEHDCTADNTTDGFGNQGGHGVEEVYLQVEVTEVN